MNIYHKISSQPGFVSGGDQGVRATSEDIVTAAAAAAFVGAVAAVSIVIHGCGSTEALPIGPTGQYFFTLRFNGRGGRVVNDVRLRSLQPQHNT